MNRPGVTVAALLLLCLDVSAGDSIVSVKLESYATYSAVGLELTYSGDDNGNSTAAYQWRVVGESDWRNGVDMTIDRKNRLMCSSIWPLSQAQEIEIRLRVTDPDGGSTNVSARKTTRQMILQPVGGRSWYVSAKSGDDANSGQKSAPFRTLSRAIKATRSGDTVYAMTGIYREGDIGSYLKGTPAKPITIAAASGEKPVLDNSRRVDAGDPIWKSAGGDMQFIAADFGSLSEGYVAQDGQRMYRYRSLAELRNDAHKTQRCWFYDAAAKRLYVRTGTAQPPTKHGYNIATSAYGFLLEGSRHVVIRGFEVRFFAAAGIRISSPNAQGNVILENVIHNCGNGVFIKSETTDNSAVWRNHIYEPGLNDFSWDAIKQSDYGRQGVNVTYAGRGTSICFNNVHDWFDAIVALSWHRPDQRGLHRDMDVMFNRLWNLGDDALELDGGGVNMRVHENRIRNAHTAISLAPVERGPVYVTRNDATFHSLLFKLSVGAPSSGWTYCYHNSGYTLNDSNEATMIRFNDHRHVDTNRVFRNNAMIGSEYSVHRGRAGHELDYNCYFNTPQTGFRKFTWGKATHTSLKSFQQASGQEQHGLYADPKFRDTSGLGKYSSRSNLDDAQAGDMRLQATSPLIDRAVVIRGISDDFAGQAPDIGAFERRE